MRALPSFGTECYGSLSTSVIFKKKLSPETKTHMARDHYELLTSLSKEIQIFKQVKSLVTNLTTTLIL